VGQVEEEAVPESPRNRQQQRSVLTKQGGNTLLLELEVLESALRAEVEAKENSHIREAFARFLDLEKMQAALMRVKEQEAQLEIELERARAIVAANTARQRALFLRVLRGYRERTNLGIRYHRRALLDAAKDTAARRIQMNMRAMHARCIIRARRLARDAQINVALRNSAATKIQTMARGASSTNAVEKRKLTLARYLEDSSAASELEHMKALEALAVEELAAIERVKVQSREGVRRLKNEITSLEASSPEGLTILSSTQKEAVENPMTEIGCSFDLLHQIESDNAERNTRAVKHVLIVQQYLRQRHGKVVLREKSDLFAGALSIQAASRAEAASRIQGLQRMADARAVLSKRMFAESMKYNAATSASTEVVEAYAACRIQCLMRVRKARKLVLAKQGSVAAALEKDDQERGAAVIQKSYKQYQQSAQEIAAAKEKLEVLRVKREEERKKKLETDE
jgi:hypothetical protein